MIAALVWFVLLALFGDCLARWLLPRDVGLADRAVLAWWLGYVAMACWLGSCTALGWLAWPALAPPACMALVSAWQLRAIVLERPRVAPWLGLLAIVLAIHLVIALLPPTEGDSLAYHFVLPQRFVATGRFVVEPIAVMGAIPLLSHVAATGPLLLGGEAALAGHAALLTCMAALAVWRLARTMLERDDAALVALLVATVPAFTYGAGTGLVELPLLGVLSAAGVCLVHAVTSSMRPWRHAAALLVGAAAGMKASGLLAAAVACAVVLLCAGRHRARETWTFAGLAALVALPWYGVVAWQVGDPLFPLLGHAWPQDQLRVFQQLYVQVERMGDHDLTGFLTWPVRLLLDGRRLDSARTGLGPLFAGSLLLSGTAASWIAVRRHHSLPARFVLVATVAALAFAALWYGLGVSGRDRHLLPILPLLVVAAFVVGRRALAHAVQPWRRAVQAGVLTLLAAQLGAFAVLAAPAVRHLAQGRPAAAWRQDRVRAIELADWLNGHLDPTRNGVFSPETRSLAAVIRAPNLTADGALQAIIPVAANDTAAVWRALRARGYDHWATATDPRNPSGDDPRNGHEHLRALLRLGCANEIAVISGRRWRSRSAPSLGGRDVTYRVHRLAAACALDPVRP